jgi:siroheme synthase
VTRTTNKVTVSTFAGAATAVLLWLLSAKWQITAPPGIESAITVIIMFGAQIFVKNAPTPVTVVDLEDERSDM